MSFYQINLAVFAAGNAYLLYRRYRTEQKPPDSLPFPTEDRDSDRDVEIELPGGGGLAASSEAANKFKRDFFLVYALAVAADWLQVP
jgi:hypothetical protein